MSEQSLIDGLKQIFSLHRARVHNQKCRLNKARMCLEKALAYGPRSEYYTLALAFDGLLKIGEDDLRASQESFALCLRITENKKSKNDRFVAHFCNLWLAIYNEKVGFDEIKYADEMVRSARHDASMFAQSILIMPKQKAVDEIFADRKAIGEAIERLSGTQNVNVRLNF